MPALFDTCGNQLRGGDGSWCAIGVLIGEIFWSNPDMLPPDAIHSAVSWIGICSSSSLSCSFIPTMATTKDPTAFGVKYPIDKAFVAPDLFYLKKWHNIKYIRLTWLDLHNITRCRILSINYFERLLETATGRPGVSVVACVLGMVGLTVTNGFSAAGSYLYVADLSSMRLCTFAPGHAMLFGWFQKANIGPEQPLEYDLCPRTLLARQIS